MGADHILDLDDDNFDSEIQARKGPIIVDFWADWCAPCKRIVPALEELAQELAGRAGIARVNVDDSGDLSNRFGIRSVPTLVLFKRGKVVDQLVGAAPKAEIRALLERHLEPRAFDSPRPPK